MLCFLVTLLFVLFCEQLRHTEIYFNSITASSTDWFFRTEAARTPSSTATGRTAQAPTDWFWSGGGGPRVRVTGAGAAVAASDPPAGDLADFDIGHDGPGDFDARLGEPSFTEKFWGSRPFGRLQNGLEGDGLAGLSSPVPTDAHAWWWIGGGTTAPRHARRVGVADRAAPSSSTTAHPTAPRTLAIDHERQGDLADCGSRAGIRVSLLTSAETQWPTIPWDARTKPRLTRAFASVAGSGNGGTDDHVGSRDRLALLPGQEVERQEPLVPRPALVQPVASSAQVQTRRPRFDPILGPAGQLSLFSRSEISLRECAVEQANASVHGVSCGRSSVPPSFDDVRREQLASYVFSHHEAGRAASEPEGNPVFVLPRRRPVRSADESGVSAQCGDRVSPSARAGFCDSSGEVDARADAAAAIPRPRDRHRKLPARRAGQEAGGPEAAGAEGVGGKRRRLADGAPAGATQRQIDGFDAGNAGSGFPATPARAVRDVRSAPFGRDGLAGAMPHATELVVRRAGQPEPDGAGVGAMGRDGVFPFDDVQSTASTESAGGDANNRRVTDWLRRDAPSAPRRTASRAVSLLDARRESAKPERAGIDGPSSSVHALAPADQAVEGASSSHGQYDGSVVSPSFWFASPSFGRDRRPADPIGAAAPHRAPGFSYSGRFERKSGSTVTPRSGVKRMGNKPAGFRHDVSGSSNRPGDRLVRDSDQRQVQSFLFLDVRTDSRVRQRTRVGLGRSGGILLSARESHPEGLVKDPSRRGLGNLGDSMVADQGLVRIDQTERSGHVARATPLVHSASGRSGTSVSRRQYAAADSFSAVTGALQRAQSRSWSAAQTRALTLWREFAHKHGVPEMSAPSAGSLAAFALDRLFGQALDLGDPDAVPAALARGVKPAMSASSVLSMLSALKAAFETAHWRWPDAPAQVTLLQRMRMAIRKLAPSGSSIDPREVGHFAPHLVVPVLPVGQSDMDIRDRALFMLRAVSLIRPSEPLEIMRSSVRIVDNGVGRKVVAFAVKRTKSASAKGRAFDSNSVEFLSRNAEVANLPEGLAVADVCPASLLLALRDRIDDRASSAAFEVPDRLFFCSDQRSGRFDLSRPLSDTRASTVVSNLLRAAGASDKARAHDLRAMSAQQLRLMGVDPGDIEVRGGWSSALSSQVRIDHYTSNRLVQDNFADILFDERQRRQRRQRQRLQHGSLFRAAARVEDDEVAQRAGDDEEISLSPSRMVGGRVLRSDARRVRQDPAIGGLAVQEVRARLGVSDSSSAMAESVEEETSIEAVAHRGVDSSDERTTTSEILAIWQEAAAEFGTVLMAQSDEE